MSSFVTATRHSRSCVLSLVADPVGSGFVNNLAHPRGNITGFTNFEPSMGGKWVEILKEIVPRVRHRHPQKWLPR
jgi:ABC-type uncharacterized transport system substrate-binding protein